jgi:hypothetical protein
VFTVVIGFFIPHIIDHVIKEGTKELWMKKGDHDSWGKVPGKSDLKIIRSFSVFNVTNPTEI